MSGMKTLLAAVLLTGMAAAQCAMPMPSSSTDKNKQDQKMGCCGGGGCGGGATGKAADNKSTEKADSYPSCGGSASAENASGGGCGGGGAASMCSRKTNKSQKPKANTTSPATKKK